MRPWVANLIGLMLGFAIGGEALFIYFSSRQGTSEPPVATAPPRPVPSPAPRVAVYHPALPELRPVEMPRIAPSLPPRAGPMPNVVYPEPPPSKQEPHKRGTGVAGTGFFVASDGSLLTAAHVVSGCLRMRIASQWVRPTDVDMLAIDTGQDVALLHARNVTPPATLPVGRPAGPYGKLFVLGYPASGGPLIPTETWAVLENAQLQPAPAAFVDPSRRIWVAAPAIAHGFSGGPMLDPRNGAVVGIVRGMVDSTLLHAERAAIPASGMVIGPGSLPLTALLRQEGADNDALAMSGDDALDAARRATVHVLCTY
jgi:S1-C subfamily serine protease